MAELPVSPLAPESFPEMHDVSGVELAVAETGLKYTGRPDLLLVKMPAHTTCAGVFTKSKTPAAPVDWSKDALSATGGKVQGLLVNAGNANAFTGSRGMTTAKESAACVADVLSCAQPDVVLASTGVIGEPFEASLLTPFIKEASTRLSGGGWLDAANAISTTDTFPKGASQKTRLNGKEVTITGITKGSGMIAPDMATMLGFIFTDAAMTSEVLQTLLNRVTEKSFNAVTVDGDTSTNDTVFLFATGGESEAVSDANDPALADFEAQLTAVAIDLAQQLVRDGEGATKFVTITIDGAEDDVAAKKIALAIANSPLVKTAVAGEDANWGRLVMAVGKSGEAVNRDALSIWIGDQHVAENGMVRADYSEADASAHMKQKDIVFRLDVGVGSGSATVWTCDLTHGYISINADYRS